MSCEAISRGTRGYSNLCRMAEGHKLSSGAQLVMGSLQVTPTHISAFYYSVRFTQEPSQSQTRTPREAYV